MTTFTWCKRGIRHKNTLVQFLKAYIWSYFSGLYDPLLKLFQSQDSNFTNFQFLNLKFGQISVPKFDQNSILQ